MSINRFERNPSNPEHEPDQIETELSVNMASLFPWVIMGSKAVDFITSRLKRYGYDAVSAGPFRAIVDEETGLISGCSLNVDSVYPAWNPGNLPSWPNSLSLSNFGPAITDQVSGFREELFISRPDESREMHDYIFFNNALRAQQKFEKMIRTHHPTVVVQHPYEIGQVRRIAPNETIQILLEVNPGMLDSFGRFVSLAAFVEFVQTTNAENLGIAYDIEHFSRLLQDFETRSISNPGQPTVLKITDGEALLRLFEEIPGLGSLIKMVDFKGFNVAHGDSQARQESLEEVRQTLQGKDTQLASILDVLRSSFTQENVPFRVRTEVLLPFVQQFTYIEVLRIHKEMAKYFKGTN